MPHVIYPYGPPIERAENLWQVVGTLKFPVPRNMTVVRNARGELLIYSAIAMHEEGMQALEALGRPAVMVIPHRRHQMDAPFYKARYPHLRVLAPEARRVHHVPVDGGLAELVEFGVRADVLPGNTYEDVVLDIPVPGGRALCVCETLGNIVPPPGVASLLFRLLGPPGGGFGIARAVRLREVRGAAQLRAWLEAQAERGDVRCLLFGHGEPLTRDVSGALRRAAQQL